ncbi:MAG: helix-turn-helix domain-containing protein [Alphaproteobacteria bacterium]|nr:helix-turn-helix domain-containing protein [Alphaproteobacteria bacterium]
MVTLVDTKYYGQLMRNSRRNQSVRAKDVAKMFGVSVRQLHRYEQGKEIVPENIVQSLFSNGFCLLRCKRICKK